MFKRRTDRAGTRCVRVMQHDCTTVTFKLSDPGFEVRNVLLKNLGGSRPLVGILAVDHVGTCALSADRTSAVAALC